MLRLPLSAFSLLYKGINEGYLLLEGSGKGEAKSSLSNYNSTGVYCIQLIRMFAADF